jgi:4-hydroxybenzoate polyprenyltransferase
LHPKKRFRPVPAGLVSLPIAYAEWLLLGVVGLRLALQVNGYFALSALSLWIMGIVYNVPPLRTKEWPYVDVLSESVNNAIRLFLGWFALVTTQIPPLSLVIAYWMLGAFFMATKRYAEFRHLGNPDTAAGYRRSFRHYTEERLLVSIMFYGTACALFSGIFIVRYHLELILFAPFAAGVFAYYLRIGMRPDSPVQNPEKLYRERGFFVFMVAASSVFVILMFTSIPALYDWFNVDVSRTSPLWTIGSSSR